MRLTYSSALLLQGLMPGEMRGRIALQATLIRMQPRLLSDVVGHDLMQRTPCQPPGRGTCERCRRAQLKRRSAACLSVHASRADCKDGPCAAERCGVFRPCRHS